MSNQDKFHYLLLQNFIEQQRTPWPKLMGIQQIYLFERGLYYIHFSVY